MRRMLPAKILSPSLIAACFFGLFPRINLSFLLAEEPDRISVEYISREVDKKILPEDLEWYVREKPVIKNENGEPIVPCDDKTERSFTPDNVEMKKN